VASPGHEEARAPTKGASPNNNRLSNNDQKHLTQTEYQKQAVIIDLKREFVAECLRVVALKASHGADNIELADDLNVERDIRLAVANLKEAAQAFREIERMKAGVS
jgi:hypothetical protein